MCLHSWEVPMRTTDWGGMAKAWGMVSVTWVSSFPFFSCVGRRMGKLPAAKLHQHPGMGDVHFMLSYKPQCGEECSQGIAWLLLIVLIHGWFCFCESRKTFPRSTVCQSPSFCIHSPRYLLTKLGQESCSTCCALHSLTQRLMLCRLKLADCYVPHVHLSMPSTAQWYLLLLRMKLGWVKN